MKKLAHLLVGIVIVLGFSVVAPRLCAQTASTADDKAAIEALYKTFNDSFIKKDVNSVMSVYAAGVFVFDVIPPRQYPSWNAYKKDWEELFAAFPGPVNNSVSDLNIAVEGSVAYTHFIADGTLTAKDGSKTRIVVRTTDVLRKIKGKWLIVQEHNSVPVDMATGKGDLLSKP